MGVSDMSDGVRGAAVIIFAFCIALGSMDEGSSISVQSSNSGLRFWDMLFVVLHMGIQP